MPYRNTNDSCPSLLTERAPNKTEITTRSLDPFSTTVGQRLWPSPPNPRPTRTHRTKALTNRRRRHGRAEGNAEQASVGAAPRAPSAMDPSSPPTTTAARGSSSSIHPPRYRSTRSLLRILRTRGRLKPPPMRRWQPSARGTQAAVDPPPSSPTDDKRNRWKVAPGKT